MVIAFAFALGGCGSMVRYDWESEPRFSPLRPYYLEIAESELPRICGTHPGESVHGCAVRLLSDGLCLIYTGPGPGAWLLDHERRHCAGFNHAPLRSS